MNLMLIAPLCCNALFAGAAPSTFPVLDAAATRVAVVVANVTVAGGVKLPTLQNCITPDQKVKAIDTVVRHPCSDAQPYAFQASAVKQVYGSALPASIYIATTGAQGLRNFNHGNTANLILVLTDGKHAVMPRNARARVLIDTAGAQWMVVDSKRTPSFLPCSVAGLMQELPYDKIVTELGQPYPETRGDTGEQVTVAGRLRPRFGIPVPSLQAHLAAFKPGTADIWCEPAGTQVHSVKDNSR